MTTRGEAFAGLSVAIITPLRGDKVDFDALGRQIDFQARAGTRCVCPCGTTGESPTLTHAEHDEVIAQSVKFAAGRLKVLDSSSRSSIRSRRKRRIAPRSWQWATRYQAPSMWARA